MSIEKKALILGGGVIGVSTAILLHSLGYDVEIISEQFLWDHSTDPTFASVYPAASVIPHSVGGNTKKLYEMSYAVFDQLAKSYPHIVRRQKHLELTEGAFNRKDYHEWVGAEPISKDHSLWGLKAPIRGGAAYVEGVGFDICFVEMPAYKEWLRETIQELHIKLTRQKIDRYVLPYTIDKYSVVCNCLGMHGPALVKDDDEIEGLAGVLVRIPVDGLFKNPITQAPISYNYLFKDVEAYSYPRSRDALFGGTRIPVDQGQDPVGQLKAYFDQQSIEYTHLNRIPVPRYVIEVNQEMYRQLYDVDLKVDKANAILGLRPVRKKGVRLDVTESGIVNNYGYGGAGVTLSWGGALEVVRLIGVELDFQVVLDELMDTFKPA